MENHSLQPLMIPASIVVFAGGLDPDALEPGLARHVADQLRTNGYTGELRFVDIRMTGTLAELVFCADRAYMPDDENAASITLDSFNFGLLPMVNGQSRLARRFYEEAAPMEAVRAAAGKPLGPKEAEKLGLITAAPDDIDWADEVRIALEERAAMSPDALTGLEANLRFAQNENMFTRIFGRLTAWQNWIFQRPNAVGDKGALKVYGKGDKAAFDWNRV